MEYSVHNDAAFCFVCCLFPEGVGRVSADNSWTVNGVRQWHKMKSFGTNQAKALLKKMKKYDFIFSLGIMRFIMRHCKVLVVQLQQLILVSTTTKALERIPNENDVNNQVKAAVEIAKQIGCDPEKEFSQHHRKRVAPLRLDDRNENEADVSFASFYRKEMFCVLDQLIADCKENWKQVFANIEPFSVLKPPWENISEELVESLSVLVGGSITSGNLIGELNVLPRRDK